MKARLVPPADMVVRDGESVALVGHRVVRLSRLATVLLRALDDGSWMSVTQLESRLTRELGKTPSELDSLALTIQALEALSEEGLVLCKNS